MGAHVGSERGIAELAAQQHGVVSYRQLRELGLGRSAIQYRLKLGRLHSLHRGVYAVGHRALSQRGRWMAATLACGPGSAVSHRCGASLLELLPYAGKRIDVTLMGSRRRPGIAVHRVRHLDDDQLIGVDGIPVTSVARTLRDLAGTVRPDQLSRAIEAAERQGEFDLRALERGRMPQALRAVLADYHDPGFTRSELERRFARVCRDAGLPQPSMNVWIHDQEVDAVWEDEQVAVQLDGYEFHRTRAAFERDRRSQAALQLRGYVVLRVTYRWLAGDPAEVVSALRSLLASSSSATARSTSAPNSSRSAIAS